MHAQRWLNGWASRSRCRCLCSRITAEWWLGLLVTWTRVYFGVTTSMLCCTGSFCGVPGCWRSNDGVEGCWAQCPRGWGYAVSWVLVAHLPVLSAGGQPALYEERQRAWRLAVGYQTSIIKKHGFCNVPWSTSESNGIVGNTTSAWVHN